MVAPVVVVLGVLVGYPLVRGFYLTLTDANSLNSAARSASTTIDATYEFIGLDNYAEILWGPTAYDRFWSHFVWTIVWTVACVVLHYVHRPRPGAAAQPASCAGRTVYRLLLILPWAVPDLRHRLRLAVHARRRAASSTRSSTALRPADTAWLEDPTWQRFAAIMVNTWCGVPFMMVSLLGGLQSIDAELYEAAEMDGASAWQRFRHVTLPGLRVGQLHRRPARHHLDLQPVRRHLPAVRRHRARRADPRDLGLPPRLRAAAARLRQSAAYGVLLLAILIVFTSVYRRWLNRNEQQLATEAGRRP